MTAASRLPAIIPAARPIRVGLLWHSLRTGNLGVSALAEANMRLIAEAAPAPCDFVLFGPRGTSEPTDDARNVTEQRVSGLSDLTGTARAMRGCDVLFDIGAGDSFADIYGPRRLAKTAGLKLVARLAGHAPVLSPQTIGPFRSPLTRAAARLSLSVCGPVFARDSGSAERAARLMPTGRYPVQTTDVAFALPPLDHWPRVFPRLETGKIHVGVNVSGLLMRGGYAGRGMGLAGDYGTLMRGLVGDMVARPGLRVWLMAHVDDQGGTTGESDRVACADLATAFPQARVAPAFATPGAAKSFAGAMHLVLAARMHMAIAALSMGVPTLPMAYSDKFAGLFNDLDYPHTLDLRRASPPEVIAAADRALARLGGLRAEAARARILAEARLEPYRDFLRARLAEVAT